MNHESLSSPNEPTSNYESSPDTPSQLLTCLARVALSNSETFKSPANRFRVDPRDYPLLSRQDEYSANNTDPNKHLWNIDRTAYTFVNRTAELIARIDGSAIDYELNPNLPRPDHLIYLDKSARPVSWFVNTFWDDLSTQKRPAHSYLNIDRLDWFARTNTKVTPGGYLNEGNNNDNRAARSRDFHIENVSPVDIARIRALYLPEGIASEDPETIMHTPTKLDGKSILIIDEVKNTGSTLEIAKQLLRAAIPEAKTIDAVGFWKSSYRKTKDGEDQLLSAPVWYDSSKTEGRGIGEIEPEYFTEQYDKYPILALVPANLVLSSSAALSILPPRKTSLLAN